MTIATFRARAVRLATIALLAAAACGEDSESGATGPTMRPGEDCLSCHAFTLAGTVYAADTGQGVGAVNVTVTDNGGGVTSLVSNSVGNFYTTNPVTFPVNVSVSRGNGTSSMSGQNGQNGHCNGCHDALMRITVP